MKRITFFIILIILFFGCATTITTRMINQSISNIKIEQKELLDAISYVLMENGFDIKMVNESIGIINTEWRPIKAGGDTALSVLSVLASKSPTAYSRVLMFQARITDSGYKLAPKVKKIQERSSIFGTTTSEKIEYPSENTGEGKLAVRIIEEINAMLNITDSYVWEEKVISVGAE